MSKSQSRGVLKVVALTERPLWIARAAQALEATGELSGCQKPRLGCWLVGVGCGRTKRGFILEKTVHFYSFQGSESFQETIKNPAKTAGF